MTAPGTPHAPQDLELPVAVSADQLVLGGMPAAPAPVPLSLWRRPLRGPSRRTLLSLTAVVAVLAAGGGGAYRLGTEHAALGPTVLAAAPVGPQSVAQSVFAIAHTSVVTLQVPGGGTGSGFFYRPGRILTNYHVLATSTAAAAALRAGSSTTVDVLLSDGRKRTGTVRLADSRLDMAIVEVPADLGVAPLAFADVATAAPGQPVVVIGSPLGMAASVTQGVLSGEGRATQFAEDPVQNGLLQTDAAVNPGNSGGPLLDETGRVLGMVTLRPDTVAGRTVSDVAFALPADALLAAVNQLEEYGTVSHPALGVSLRDATVDDGAPGAVVTAVTSGSAAAQAQLKAGDVLTRFAGVPVTRGADVVRAVIGHRAGDRVDVQVLRAGRPLTVPVVLQERPGT